MSNNNNLQEVQPNPYIEINNLYALIGRKQTELEAYKNITGALQNKVKELSNKIKELEGNGSPGSN